MGLIDGFALDDGEIPRDELDVACLDRKQKAFGLFPHAAIGVLFATRRRVVFLVEGTPSFEAELRRLVSASFRPASLRSLAPLLVLRYRDADGRIDSVRFRYVGGIDTGRISAAVLPGWIESLAQLMREEHLELERL